MRGFVSKKLKMQSDWWAKNVLNLSPPQADTSTDTIHRHHTFPLDTLHKIKNMIAMKYNVLN